MPNTAPSIGRIVHYTLNDTNAERIDNQRFDFDHCNGNAVQAGDTFPMLITRVFESGSVNGQVFLDGTDSLWVTSVGEGDEEGHWAWPTIR